MPNLVIAFACLLAIAAPVQQPDWLGDLAKAEALWKSQRPRSYEMTVDVLCPGLCYPLPKVPPVFQVVGDQSKQIGGGVIDARSLRTYDTANTVEKLFDTVRQIATGKPYRLSVAYDPKLGYPTSMSWDRHQTISDDELTIRVTTFKVLGER